MNELGKLEYWEINDYHGDVYGGMCDNCFWRFAEYDVLFRKGNLKLCIDCLEIAEDREKNNRRENKK